MGRDVLPSVLCKSVQRLTVQTAPNTDADPQVPLFGEPQHTRPQQQQHPPYRQLISCPVQECTCTLAQVFTTLHPAAP